MTRGGGEGDGTGLDSCTSSILGFGGDEPQPDSTTVATGTLCTVVVLLLIVLGIKTAGCEYGAIGTGRLMWRIEAIEGERIIEH